MTLKYIWRSFSLSCHFHVHFSYPWHAFVLHGLPAIAELLVLPCDAIRCTVLVIVILSLRPSVVRPSVTLVDCVHMVGPTIMISSPYGSPLACFRVALSSSNSWAYCIFNRCRSWSSVVECRYYLRVTMVRRLSDLIKEQEILVHALSHYPEMNNSIKMEVGIEDCLHIEFEYNKSKWVCRFPNHRMHVCNAPLQL